MKDVSGKFEYKGKMYRLVFNLNVMEAIQEEYGSIEKWGELTSGGEGNARAVKFGFAAMINEAIDIDNEQNGTDNKPFSLLQIGRMLSEIGLDNVAELLKETVVDSTKIEEKNG